MKDESLIKAEKVGILKRLILSTKPIWGWLFLCIVIMIISLGCSLYSPIVSGDVIQFVKDYAENPSLGFDMQKFTDTCVLLASLYAGYALCSVLKMLIMNNVVSKQFTCALRIKISEKIKNLPVSYIDSTPNGEVISRMTEDVSTMGNTVHRFLDLVFSGILQIVAIAVIMFLINPWLALTIVVIVPFSVFISSKIAAKSESHFANSHKYFGKVTSIDEEDYGGFETVKAYNLEKWQNDRQGKMVDVLTAENYAGYYLSNIVQPIISFTNSVAYVIVCVLGGYLAINGVISLANVVSVVLYAKLFATPLEQIANAFSTLQQTIAAARRVYTLMDEKDMSADVPHEKTKTEGAVVFEDVCFSYNPEVPLIRNFNLYANPGQKVAIVGPTGAGKTTLINLLMRFYDVDSGKITVDGVNVMDMPRRDLREKFSMVLQETWLFNGTVFENIAYGKPDATLEEVQAAARAAHVEHFINTLPDGYNTMINEDSTNVSSGQKQLLTIARAFLANRPMLILDEATSNVDTRTEVLIHGAMDELMKNKTSFVIAHRLSTIVDADVILVVKDGQMVEKGTHETLMAKNGFYTEIYNSQYALLK